MATSTQGLQHDKSKKLEAMHAEVIRCVRKGQAENLEAILKPIEKTKECSNLLSRISKTGQFPLHYSIKDMTFDDEHRTDRLDIVRIIIRSLRKEDRYKHFELREKLTSHTALHTAAANNELGVIKEILESITSDERRKLLEKRDKRGQAVSEYPLTTEMTNLLQSMNRLGNSQEATDCDGSDDGWTLVDEADHLGRARQNEDEHAKDMLLWLWGPDEGGGDQRVEPEQVNAETAFKYFDNMLEFVRADDSYDVLIDALRNSDGKTILHIAAIHRRDDLVEKLLQLIPRSESLTRLILLPCNKGKTSLHYASSANSPPIVNLLLKHCASSEQWNLLSTICHEGKTALHHTCEVNSLDIAQTLLHHSKENDCEFVRINDKDPAAKYARPDMKTFLEHAETYYWKTFHKRPTTHIFYNAFDDYQLPIKREGAEEEKDQMVEAFTNIGLDPQVHQGFTEEKLKTEIGRAIQAEGEYISAIIVVLMSHGKENIVLDEYCREIKLQNILNILCLNSLTRGVPKVLILQSCLTVDGLPESMHNGATTNSGVELVGINPGIRSTRQNSYRFPCNDCCVITSTARGKRSERGLLARTLTKITRAKSRDSRDEACDIRNIFLEINRKMKIKQSPTIHHNFSKILLLRPPQQEPGVFEKLKKLWSK